LLIQLLLYPSRGAD